MLRACGGEDGVLDSVYTFLLYRFMKVLSRSVGRTRGKGEFEARNGGVLMGLRWLGTELCVSFARVVSWLWLRKQVPSSKLLELFYSLPTSLLPHTRREGKKGKPRTHRTRRRKSESRTIAS